MSITSLLNNTGSSTPESPLSNASSSWPSPSTFSSSSTFASSPAVAMASPATYYSDKVASASHAVTSAKLKLQPPQTEAPTQRQQQRQPIHVATEFVRARPKGVVYFRPFQHGLDAKARRAMEEFRVFPLGRIEEYCRHIPYASGKKSFHEKTGREGFEGTYSARPAGRFVLFRLRADNCLFSRAVFQYIYKVPGEDFEYHVMWDYNVGLVRMTPFFKCCKYSKTTPAKMLNMNPGLRDITHSITGGSIMAQGYWMPYACARAVCATFCHRIAGAMIPLFGPDFPSQCISSHSPDFGRMVIDQAIVVGAAREAERMRLATRPPAASVFASVAASAAASATADTSGILTSRSTHPSSSSSSSAPSASSTSRRRLRRSDSEQAGLGMHRAGLPDSLKLQESRLSSASSPARLERLPSVAHLLPPLLLFPALPRLPEFPHEAVNHYGQHHDHHDSHDHHRLHGHHDHRFVNSTRSIFAAPAPAAALPPCHNAVEHASQHGPNHHRHPQLLYLSSPNSSNISSDGDLGRATTTMADSQAPLPPPAPLAPLAYLARNRASSPGPTLPSPGRHMYTLPPLLQYRPALQAPELAAAAATVAALARGREAVDRVHSPEPEGGIDLELQAKRASVIGVIDVIDVIGDGDREDKHDQRASSACYPSPPALAAMLPPLATVQSRRGLSRSVDSRQQPEDGKKRGGMGGSTTAAAAPLPSAAERRTRATVSGDATNATNATDMDAAELLVNFSVQVRTGGSESEAEVEKEAMEQRREMADEGRRELPLSTVLCDESRPRKRRRVVSL